MHDQRCSYDDEQLTVLSVLWEGEEEGRWEGEGWEGEEERGRVGEKGRREKGKVGGGRAVCNKVQGEGKTEGVGSPPQHTWRICPVELLQKTQCLHRTRPQVMSTQNDNSILANQV